MTLVLVVSAQSQDDCSYLVQGILVHDILVSEDGKDEVEKAKRLTWKKNQDKTGMSQRRQWGLFLENIRDSWRRASEVFTGYPRIVIGRKIKEVKSHEHVWMSYIN